MPPACDSQALLDFLQEPVLVLTPAGIVLQTNAAARRTAGADLVGRNLADLISSPRDELQTYLRRCSGTAVPLPGSITIGGPDGAGVKLRTYGARLAGAAEPVRLALRCTPVRSDEFSVLATKVQELSAEIHERRRIQAALEETLRGNEILLRELHHRVKNNLQLILGMFAAARRETRSDEVKAFIDAASQRLLAIGTAQQLMYQSQEMRMVPIARFLRTLCGAVNAAFGPDVRLQVTAGDGEISNETAFPLALILNELLTNAVKHGLPGGRGTVQVILRAEQGEFTLIVQDNGPGFVADGPERRSSGLGLVRGLCRQIGGALQVESVNGTRCTLRFSDRLHGGKEL